MLRSDSDYKKMKIERKHYARRQGLIICETKKIICLSTPKAPNFVPSLARPGKAEFEKSVLQLQFP